MFNCVLGRRRPPGRRETGACHSSGEFIVLKVMLVYYCAACVYRYHLVVCKCGILLCSNTCRRFCGRYMSVCWDFGHRQCVKRLSRSQRDPAQALSCILHMLDGFSWHHNSANIECQSAIFLLLFFALPKFFFSTFQGG